MRIDNPELIKTPNYLRVTDLDYGDVFQFVDEKNIYLWTENDMAVNIEDGQCISYEDCCSYPVKQIQGNFHIEES